jgi:hypothetical protein
MTSQIYQIVFNGEIATDWDVDVVKGNLVELFKADIPAINRIFCGQPVVIKRNLDPEGAIVYLSAITQAGAVARMELMPGAREGSVTTEHRKVARRQAAKRRKRLRDETFVPDRREVHDRRHPIDSLK